MKRILAALLIMALLALPIAGALAFSLTLPENPSTGYTWTYAGSNEKVLMLLSSTYAPSADSSDKVGAGGKRTWEFQKGEDGDTVLRFVSARGDGTEPALQQNYLYRIEGGILLSRGDCRTEGGNVTITLPENPTTGYTWRTAGDKEGILSLKEDAYTPWLNSEGFLGRGGIHRWNYVAEAPGDVAFTFTNARSGDDNETETFVFAFRVDQDLVITPIYP